MCNGEREQGEIERERERESPSCVRTDLAGRRELGLEGSNPILALPHLRHQFLLRERVSVCAWEGGRGLVCVRVCVRKGCRGEGMEEGWEEGLSSCCVRVCARVGA